MADPAPLDVGLLPTSDGQLLHRAWPGSELVVLGDAGHGGAGFGEARAEALERFRSPT